MLYLIPCQTKEIVHGIFFLHQMTVYIYIRRLDIQPSLVLESTEMSFTLGAGVTHFLQPVDAVRDTRAEATPVKEKHYFKLVDLL